MTSYPPPASARRSLTLMNSNACTSRKLLHAHRHVQDVVLADRVHLSHRRIVLTGLRREAVDALLHQLHRSRRGHVVHVRVREPELRTGRLDQLVRHDVVVHDLEHRAGLEGDGERRPRLTVREVPYVTAAHLVGDRHRGDPVCGSRRRDHERGGRRECECPCADHPFARHDFSSRMCCSTVLGAASEGPSARCLNRPADFPQSRCARLRMRRKRRTYTLRPCADEAMRSGGRRKTARAKPGSSSWERCTLSSRATATAGLRCRSTRSWGSSTHVERASYADAARPPFASVASTRPDVGTRTRYREAARFAVRSPYGRCASSPSVATRVAASLFSSVVKLVRL